MRSRENKCLDFYLEDVKATHIFDFDSAPSGEIKGEEAEAKGVGEKGSNSKQCFLFIKYFDPNPTALTDKLTFCGTLMADARTVLDDLHPTFRHMASAANGGTPLSPDIPLQVFEELDPTRVNLLTGTESLAEAELQHGDVLFVQADPKALPLVEARNKQNPSKPVDVDTELQSHLEEGRGEEQEEDLDSAAGGDSYQQCLSVEVFFGDVLSRINVIFKRIDAGQNLVDSVGGQDTSVEVEMSKRWSYQQVVGKLAEAITAKNAATAAGVSADVSEQEVGSVQPVRPDHLQLFLHADNQWGSRTNISKDPILIEDADRYSLVSW